MSEACAEAILSPTPAASCDADLIPETDTVEDEVALLQDIIGEFFVRLRILLDNVQRRTTA